MLKDCIKAQEKKKRAVALWSRSRATTAKKCTKKRAKLLFC